MEVIQTHNWSEPVSLPVSPDDEVPARVLTNDYRRAAERFVGILCELDRLMVESPCSARTWVAISITLALPSAVESGVSMSHLARCTSVSKMSISKECHKISNRLGVPLAFGTGRYPTFKDIT